MPDYTSIRNHCLNIQHLTSTVIDDFLIYYAAQQDRLDRNAEKELNRYRHISKKLPEKWQNMSITQYIGHRVFRQGGLIKKYINHSGLSHLTDREMAFLEFQKEHPWRFSFAWITSNPEPDFFKMYDPFTDEYYLIYSPSMTKIRQTHNPTLWFNLIAFNGECYQAYGLIAGYSAFESRDILFYATKLNRGQWFENDSELMENVEQNPVPYMLLFSGSTLPRTFHKDDQIVEVLAEYLDDSFDTAQFGKEFTKEYSQGVYKLSPAVCDQYPHYAEAYYDEKEELLTLYSITERGFRMLVDWFNECGYHLSYEPEVRVNMAMIKTAKDILKQEIIVNKYEKLFRIKDSDEDSKEMENINSMFDELIPNINDGKKPDLDALVTKYGVDSETFVNLSDYPDPDTDEFFAISPEEQINLEYYNILTQEATAVKPGSRVISHLWCVENNEQGDLCEGEIELIRIQLPSEVRWKCRRCGQHGKIAGFEDGPSDLSHLPEDEARQFIEESYGIGMDRNGPDAVFEDHSGGLNPKQLYNFLRCDWEKNEGPLLLNGKLAAKDVSGSILFHNARTMLLKGQKEGGLGLTQTGNLQRKPISELMPECIWPDDYLETIKEYNKVVNEDDIWLLHSTRILLELACLLRKHKGALKGVKKQAGLSLGSRSGELYRHLFITYFRNMNISYLSNDMQDYPNVQENMPFALYRMQQLAEDWVSVNELTENIMVPMAFNDIATRVNSYTKPGDLVYSLVLEPLELFGLIETRKTGDESKRSYRPDHCRKTLLFDKFISFRF